MKKNILLILVLIMVLVSCSKNKNELISRAWICDKVTGLNFQKAEDAIEAKIKNDPSLKTADLEMSWSFLGNLQENIPMQKDVPGKWIFDKNGTLTAVKVWNYYSENGRGTENLNWKINSDSLIISGTNSDKHEVNLFFFIETLNEKEMILKKNILDSTVRIHYSVFENENSSNDTSNSEINNQENLTNDFKAGTYYPIDGPQQAPLGQVELTKKGEAYFLKFMMANKWQDIGCVKPMTTSDLVGSIGHQSESADAKGLSNGFVAFIIIKPDSKIRGYSISTGIALISPAFGPGGLAILKKK